MSSLYPGRPKRSLRKHILLFGISVLLPALVLLLFTLRLNRQDNELRKRRAGETRQQKAEEIGRFLEERLQKIEKAFLQEMSVDPLTLQTANLTYPELVFVGRIIGEELQMPWDIAMSRASPAKNARSEELVLRAQQSEFKAQDIGQAEKLFNLALSAATSPSQKVFIQLEIGRLLSKSGYLDKAARLDEEILNQPGDLTDENGMPFVLFAAERLLTLNGKTEMVIARLEALLKEIEWFPSIALYFIRDITALIIEKTQTSSYLDRVKDLDLSVDARLKVQGKIQSLKTMVAAWMAQDRTSRQTGEPTNWESYGEIPWIVGICKEDETGEPFLFCFHGPKILNAVIEENDLAERFPGACRMGSALENRGVSLGGRLQGFRIQFEETDVSAWSKSSLPFPVFYWLILFLVVGFTGFGMYLLWRDFNRELALAEMKSHFAANVSHELKTPLTSIRMFAEALTMGVKEQPEAQKEYLQTIISESERLSRLLNNVLDFSKIEQGTRIYRFESISLEEVINSSAKALSFPLDQKGISLRIDVEQGIPEVSADKDAIEQAVLNLLHNALKYSGESREIVLKLRREDHSACIDVVDFGIGISEEDKNRIFGKYFRVSGLENQRIPGTGLGLAIVSHIAEAHGGRVKVMSQSGKGSIFSLVIPLERG